jgi:6-phosphogluconolactonase (cycloisomerase 2 family)
MAGASTAHHHPVGAVYTESNDVIANTVVVFDRFQDGTLVKRQSVVTGGVGSPQVTGCGGCAILDSQTAVVASNDGKLVFAVNAGSDTVSSFRETHSGLQLVDQKPSGGDMPESLALNDHVLYVLNVSTANTNGTTGNIYGYRVSGNGQLTPNGSSQPLAHFAPPDRSGDARAIGFKPNGKVIVVTEIAGGFESGPPGKIDTFLVNSHGQAGTVVSHDSSDTFPFGFAFDKHSHMVVSNIHDLTPGMPGTASSYSVSDSGDVTPIDTKPASGRAPCWVAIAHHHAYVVDTGGGEGPAQVVDFQRGIVGHAGDFAETDADFSHDKKYLYVLAPSVGVPGQNSHIDRFLRNHDGSLTYLGATAPDPDMGPGVSGIAAN